MEKEKIDQYIEEHRVLRKKSSTFVEYLYQLMDARGVDNPTLYNKANISRQLFSSIISEKSNPSLNVCLKIVFALELTNSECKYLLKKAGYTLASSSKYALIIRYFIENGIYNLAELNDALTEYGYKDSLIY
jgi:DNA-binding phage protein